MRTFFHSFPRILRPPLHVSRPNARTITSAVVSACSCRRFGAGATTTRSIIQTSGDIERRGVGDVMALDGVRIPRSLMARSSRIPGNPQSAGDVRHWSDHRDDHRAAGADSSSAPTTSPRVVGTDVALALIVGGLCWLIGWKSFLIVWAPAAMLAGAVGSGCSTSSINSRTRTGQSSADWSYDAAALQGGSYAEDAQGAAVLHGQHRPAPRAWPRRADSAVRPPARADENPVFRNLPTLSLWDGARAVRLKLWDEQAHKLVTSRRRATMVTQAGHATRNRVGRCEQANLLRRR